MEYKLISSTDAEYVAKTVNESLAEGWELLGSVAVGVTPGTHIGTHIIPVVYVQAMTKPFVPPWVKRSRARMQARAEELSQADEHKESEVIQHSIDADNKPLTARSLADILKTLF